MQTQTIIDLYRRGAPVSRLARAAGTTSSAISHKVKSYKIDRPRFQFPQDSTALAVYLHDNENIKLTPEEIELLTGVNPLSVDDVWKDGGDGRETCRRCCLIFADADGRRRQDDGICEWCDEEVERPEWIKARPVMKYKWKQMEAGD